MNVVALHKTSLYVYNLINVDSITKTGDTIAVHGVPASAPSSSATTINFPAADYLISIVAN